MVAGRSSLNLLYLQTAEKHFEEKHLWYPSQAIYSEKDDYIMRFFSMYDKIADKKVIEKTMEALSHRGIQAELVNSKEQAIDKLKEIIHPGASIMTGSSTTLNEIGFTEVLISKNHDWNNLKDEIVAEKDKEKQNELRIKSITADFFLGSVHAVTESGEVLIASATGSQLPSYAFSSDNVVWVVGTQKIVPNLEEAFKRLKTYVFPLEDARMKSTGAQGSAIGKVLIFEREIMPNRKIFLIFVNEKLGY